MNPSDRVAIEKIELKRFEGHCEARISRMDVDRMPLGLRFQILEDEAYSLAMRLSGFLWSQEIQDEKVTLKADFEATFEASWPADWWQHFKQRWFPSWALRRWPVKLEFKRETKRDTKTETHIFKTVALLPEFKYSAPRGCGETYVLKTRVGRDWR